jgi:hypothetical protein
MELPVVKIASNVRHLGKMKRGGKVRLCGGDFPICLLPENHKKVMKAIGRGVGIHHAFLPEEIAANHGRGFFDDIKSGLSDAYSKGKDIAVNTIAPIARDAAGEARNFAVNTAAPAARDAGKVLLPIAKLAANKAIDYGMEYGPEALGGLAAAAATATGNPELAPFAYAAGKAAGKAGGQALGGYVKGQLNSYDPYHTQQVDDSGEVMSPAYNANAPPSRQPQTNMLNAYTGQKMGALDRANMGQYEANMGLSQLEALVAQKRSQLGAPHFDYSGGKSMSQYADAVRPTGMGLYAGGRGRGLYGGSVISEATDWTKMIGRGAIVHPRMGRHRREMGSIGIQGNLLGAAEPAALRSQAYSANFQFGHTLPPAYQKFAHSGSGLY